MHILMLKKIQVDVLLIHREAREYIFWNVIDALFHFEVIVIGVLFISATFFFLQIITSIIKRSKDAI
jgi:hypothetical protein